ncbi:MAG TPA: tRNA pseudouridine(38-40) synthase TruA [Kineosporiaceae bacterium]
MAEAVVPAPAPEEPPARPVGSGSLGTGAGDDGFVRIRLDLDYDGTGFAGWAVQPGLRTVAGTLAAALGAVLRTDPQSLGLVVAGRTDAGVHATGQVCHLEASRDAWAALPGRSGVPPEVALVRRLAGVLPDDVRVRAAGPAPPGFDARFSALHRRYAYRICDDPAGVPPLRRHDVLRHGRPLDAARMDAAARALTGLHDFAAFCRRRQGATTVRTLLEYSWDRDAADLVVARVVADAFCHSMVRALVGAVLPVGEGRREVGWPAQVLARGVRDPAVTVAPPHGLVLEEVGYPDVAGLAERARQARAVRVLPGR